MEFIRHFEEIEELTLSPYAQRSHDSRGRQYEITPCYMRTCYMRDCDRIIHCKSFRRLKHKTQVFFAPEGDHYRTRLTHTLEVSQIARAIARLLRLNENLTEAIALGHDLGHTPFGHAGEHALFEKTGFFEHNVHSVRVAEVLENLNLTYEVLDGIRNHKKSLKPATLEGYAVNYADRIAYINHDIDDAIRAGLLKTEDLPKNCLELFGHTHGQRINSMIEDIVLNSIDKPYIRMTEQAEERLNQLRTYMFEKVYLHPDVYEERVKAERLISLLYDYYIEHINELPPVHRDRLEEFGAVQSVVDFVAGMTDRYAIAVFEDIFMPENWRK